jgi:hypothetical protein
MSNAQVPAVEGWFTSEGPGGAPALLASRCTSCGTLFTATADDGTSEDQLVGCGARSGPPQLMQRSRHEHRPPGITANQGLFRNASAVIVSR